MDAPNDSEMVIPVGEFLKRAEELLAKLESGRPQRITITKRGRPVAVIEGKTKPVPDAEFKPLFGAMKGMITIPDGVDITAPTGEVWDAERD
jgi:antitoxin (DNA-binding transcriptional repressor) of toxin-antitoxin stability system